MSWLQGISLVSWDVDGTLYDLEALKRALVWDCVRRTFKQPSVWRELRDLQRYFHFVDSKRGASLAPDWQRGQEQRAARHVAWVERMITKLPARNDAVALIEQATTAGITQVALSDFAPEAKLQSLGLRHHFAAAYSCQDLGAFKPSPAPFLAVQKNHGVPPSAHLHIGDRDDTDGAGARAAGARVMIL